jgi:hypothetical protein
MKLTAEQLQENWDELMSYIDKYISEPRASKLKEFYEKYSERLALMPAANKKEYHNAFPGGYIEHVNRVVKASLEFDKIWTAFGVEKNYTTEELVFSAINHDLGKMGDDKNEAYIPQTDAWRREKLGEDYTFNTALEFMPVPDRGLYLLNQHGINYSKNEFLAIKLHDGLYDDANKPYLINFAPETKPRTSLVFIIHQADLMAARIEFEREWMPKFNKTNLEKQKKVITLDESKKEKPTKLKALGTIKSASLQSAMKEFFDADEK